MNSISQFENFGPRKIYLQSPTRTSLSKFANLYIPFYDGIRAIIICFVPVEFDWYKPARLAELYRKDWKLISQSCLHSALKRKFSCYLATSFVPASFSAAPRAFICRPPFTMNVAGHLGCAFGPKSGFFYGEFEVCSATGAHTTWRPHTGKE